METYELYKRSLGHMYDEERVLHEVHNGVAGYTESFEPSNGFELNGSDLYVKMVESSENAARLQEIEYELAMLLDVRQPSVEDIERVLVLEAEKVVRLEAEVEELLGDETVPADELKKLFMNQLQERMKAGQPVDSEMFAESGELASTIAEQHPGLNSEGLLRIAEAMEALILAQLTLEKHIDSPDELRLVA